MNKQQIIEKTASYIKQAFAEAEGAHDWWHSYRVWQTAKRIASEERADSFVVELAALMHDLDDWKNKEGGDFTPKRALEWLSDNAIDADSTARIRAAIEATYLDIASPELETAMNNLEARVVWDADKIDAIGAVGIARVFTYGGHIGRALHNPDVEVVDYRTLEQYNAHHANGTSINHFYEKLLKLKDLMNTTFGKKLAQGRHEHMEKFLEQFYAEWEGER